jgi:hypothetical protein
MQKFDLKSNRAKCVWVLFRLLGFLLGIYESHIVIPKKPSIQTDGFLFDKNKKLVYNIHRKKPIKEILFYEY